MDEREMTLKEWCGRLPDCHLVNRQLKEREWIETSKEKPIVPEDRHAVSVIVAVYDPVYAEGKKDPSSGYDVFQAVYTKEGIFQDLAYSTKGEGTKWYQIDDEVTHWMYMPKPPIYKGDI